MKRFVVALAVAIAQFSQPQGQLFGFDAAPAPYKAGVAVRNEAIESINRKVSDDIIKVDDDFLGARPQNTTKYPIVLVHGFLGWDQVFYLDYFYHIRTRLQAEGFEVYAPRVNPVNSIDVRAKELAPVIDSILKSSGAEKVNIIAHSMGGLDARYLASQGFGSKIASITMIGTPNRGTPVPDLVFAVLGKKDNIIYKAFEYLVSAFLGGGKLDPQSLDLRACLWNLSETFMESYFNATVKDDPGIYMQSYAGVSSLTGWSTGDRVDYLLMPFQPAFAYGEKSDGLVPVDSAQWGRFRGIVSADHVNLVGQLFGNTSVRFSHVNFYKKIAYELVDLGF